MQPILILRTPFRSQYLGLELQSLELVPPKRDLEAVNIYHLWRYSRSLCKSEIELANTSDGTFSREDESARSMRLRTPCNWGMNDFTDILKSTFHAGDDVS